MDKKGKKNHLERTRHIIWIIVGLITIVFLFFGIQLVINVNKYFP